MESFSARRLKRLALVADDHKMLRELSLIAVQQMGFGRVLMAENAEGALKAFNDNGPSNFDLVLTDVQMPLPDGSPGKGGLWLADVIRSGNPDLPIIIMSSDFSTEEKARALSITPHVIEKGKDAAFISKIKLAILDIFKIG